MSAGQAASVQVQAQALAMLRAAWQWRRNDGSLWALRLYGLLLVLLLGVPALAAMVWMPPRAAWPTAGVLAFLGLVVVWGTQFGALLRLDHPHAAHTVPGYQAALRAAAVGLWLLMVAACAVLASTAAALLGWPAWHTGLWVALAAGAVLLVVALGTRWWLVWVPVCLVPSLLGWRVWRDAVFDSWAWMQSQWLAQPLASTVALLLAMGLLLCTVFGRGDATHARVYAGRENMRRLAAMGAAGHKPALAAYGRWGEWLSRPAEHLFEAWLGRLLQQARHAPAPLRSVMARAELVLHGHQHWVRQLGSLLFVQATLGLCLITTALTVGLPMSTLLAHGRLGIGIGLFSMAYGMAAGLLPALSSSRREQALLMLLPGMPRGAALNRALARQQLHHCLRVWAALLPALVALVWAGPAGPTVVLLSVALPLSAWLWRDHASARPPRPAATYLPMVAFIAVGVVSVPLLRWQPGAALPVALSALLLTAGLLAWRWRRLDSLPQALPAGRLA